MRRNDIEGRDVQPELARLGELADAGAQGQQVVSCDRCRQVRYRLAYVIDSAVMQTEDMSFCDLSAGFVGWSDEAIQ